MLDVLRMLSLGGKAGEDKVKDIVFEQEFISFPMVATKNDQTLPTIAIENDQAPNIQEKPLIQNEELAPIHEEQR